MPISTSRSAAPMIDSSTAVDTDDARIGNHGLMAGSNGAAVLRGDSKDPFTQLMGSEPRTGNEPIEILLVDDAPDKLLALEAALSDLGETVVKAESGSEALRLLLKREFAVILLDINMPVMDGF